MTSFRAKFRLPAPAFFLIAVAVATLVPLACRSLSIKDGDLPCSKEKTCPAPFTCVDSLCRSVDGGSSSGGIGAGHAGAGGAAGVAASGGSGGAVAGSSGGGADGGSAGTPGGGTGGGAGAAGSGGAGGGAAGATGGAAGGGTAGAAGGAGGATGGGGQSPPPTVTVTIQRSGSGTITGTNVNCVDATCPITLDVGSNLTLQANAAAGWQLKQWSGCTTMTGTMCTLTNLRASTQATATFVQQNADFAIVKDGNGSGSVSASWAGGGALDCGATCSAALPPGTQVTLMATPSAGSTVQWAAPCSGSGACVVSVAAGGTTATATFTLNRYLLTAAVSGPLGAGSVLSTTAGVSINCGATCSALVDYGTTVVLAAAPSATGAFSSWTGCTTTSGTTCTIKVTAAATVTAAFKLQTGATCSTAADCKLGFCVNNVCCGTACNGVCDQSCAANTGVCTPVPKQARKSCGTFKGADFMNTTESPQNVDELCDGAGHCAGPSIQCGSAGACPLTISTSCCDTQGDYGNFRCQAPSSCYENILNCNGAGDCPAGQVCCLFNDFVLYKLYCAATCPNQQICTAGNAQECLQAGATCQPSVGYNVCM